MRSSRISLFMLLTLCRAAWEGTFPPVTADVFEQRSFRGDECHTLAPPPRSTQLLSPKWNVPTKAYVGPLI